MSLPKHILFPIDFSERCYVTWPAIQSMARQLDAPVTLLHVLDLGQLTPAARLVEVPAIRDQVQEKLNHFPGSVSEIADLRREVAEGPAAGEIVQRAATMEAPLIMMPTRGHTRFRQLLLGSVTAAVLHDAACPVWTEAHVEGPPPPARPYRSLVCAVDMGPQTPTLLQAADDYRRRFDASLHIVHSVSRGDQRFASGLSDRAHALLCANAREAYAAHCEKAGVDFPLEIVEDFRLADGINGAVARHVADLLIIGRGVIQGVMGRLRTGAHELIRSSRCPVLSI